MRTLNEHEVDEVAGGGLLLGAVSGLGSSLFGGLFGGGGSQAALAQNQSSYAQNLAGAQADMAAHGAPLPRKIQPGLDSFLQDTASCCEAFIHALAGHLSAGVRDVADLLGRII